MARLLGLSLPLSLLLLLAATVTLSSASRQTARHVLVDSDMGYDDLAAISMLLANNEYKSARAAGRARENDILDATNEREVVALETILGDLYTPNGTSIALRFLQLVNDTSALAFNDASSSKPRVPFVRQGADTFFPGGLVFPFVADQLPGVEQGLPPTSSIDPLSTLSFIDHILGQSKLFSSLLFSIFSSRSSRSSVLFLLGIKTDIAFRSIPQHNAASTAQSKFTILAIGPLTNLALLIEQRERNPFLFDTFLDSIDQIVVMGGAVNVSGNVPPLNFAEYNIRGDPHAAKVVFERLHQKIVLIPLDCMLQAVCKPDFLEAIQSILPRPFSVPSEYLKQSIQFICEEWSPNVLYDVVAASFLLDPSILTTSVMNLSIITEGPEIGRTMINGPSPHLVRVATSLDLARLYDLLLALVRGV